MAEPPAANASRPPPRAMRFLPDWKGVALTALVAILVVALVPAVRAWLLASLWWPMVADVLGRSSVTVGGTRIPAFSPSGIAIAYASLLVLALLAVRAVLLLRPGRGSSWARRVRLDSAFFLALTPFLAAAPIIDALEDSLLFQPPWAFFAVLPLLPVALAALAFASLLFALWIEDGGRPTGYRRFLVVILAFLSFHLFAIAVLDATTRRLAWWSAPLALLIGLATYHGATLGNRITSHRRTLFALGTFHLAFFASFLALWAIDGPWPSHGWTYHGVEAMRRVSDSDPWLLLLVLLPVVGITTGAYTIGAFLHRYVTWARPWVLGLNIAVLFSQALDGWANTIAYADSYGAHAAALPAPEPWVAWTLANFGPWSWFAAKTAFGLAAPLLFDLPLRGRRVAAVEAGHLARAALVALGLVPGIRIALHLSMGI